MADNMRAKAVASTINNAKQAEQRALRRAAKALKKARAREKRVQRSLGKENSQLDAALRAMEKADVASPKALDIEYAARTALKALLIQRKKLRKARKALRRAETKDQRVKERAAAAAVKRTRTEKLAAQTSQASKKRPAKHQKKSHAVARSKRAATKPRVTDAMPAAEGVSGGNVEGIQEAIGLSRAGTPARELD